MTARNRYRGGRLSRRTDRFNRQLNDNEKKVIANKAGSDKAEKDKLTKAVCYAVKCWTQYAPGSAAYSEHYVSQLEASQLQPELDWVSRQTEAGLFNYTPLQKVGDAVQSDPLGVTKDTVVGAGWGDGQDWGDDLHDHRHWLRSRRRWYGRVRPE